MKKSLYFSEIFFNNLFDYSLRPQKHTLEYNKICPLKDV